MDYLEEQRGELEALESIYENELSVLSSEPPISFTIPVRSERFNEEGGEEQLWILLKFTYTPRYDL